MLSGKQKAQLLIKLLEEKSNIILQLLDPSVSKHLSSSLEDAADLDDEAMIQFLNDTLAEIDKHRQKALELSNDEVEEIDLDSTDDEESNFEDMSLSDAEASYPDNYREISDIAERLQQQQPQLIAFFLSKAKDPLREAILNELPEELQESINQITIEPMPIADRIFERMFNNVVIKSEDEQKEESKEELVEEFEL